MSTVLRITRGLVASAATTLVIVLATLTAGVGPAGAAGALTVPQVPVARAAAQWLAGQLTPQGYIPSTTPGTAEYSETVSSLLALAASRVDLPLARAGLAYVEANVNAYVVTSEGGDGPGQLSLLILLAHAMGVDPTQFGGTNLVTRLLATEQTSGLNQGRLGPMPRWPTTTVIPTTRVWPSWR